jgi:hypothetical protein
MPEMLFQHPERRNQDSLDLLLPHRLPAQPCRIAHATYPKLLQFG